MIEDTLYEGTVAETQNEADNLLEFSHHSLRRVLLLLDAKKKTKKDWHSMQREYERASRHTGLFSKDGEIAADLEYIKKIIKIEELYGPIEAVIGVSNTSYQ